MTEISVIMPNYNGSKFIENSISSVLDQSFEDFDLIVIDDGSTDDSTSKIRKFQVADRRIRLMIHEKNLGVSASLNTGLRTVSSPLVTFMGSDDLFAGDRLRSVIDKVPPGPQPWVQYSDVLRIGADLTVVASEESNSRFRPSGDILGALLADRFEFVGGPIAAPKICFDTVGPYDENLSWGEDFEMSLRLAAKFPFVFNRTMSYGHRAHKGSTSSGIRKKERWKQQGQILEKHLDLSASRLAASDARDAYSYLFSCFVASSQWGKIVRHGMKNRLAFVSMLSIPKRALRR